MGGKYIRCVCAAHGQSGGSGAPTLCAPAPCTTRLREFNDAFEAIEAECWQMMRTNGALAASSALDHVVQVRQRRARESGCLCDAPPPPPPEQILDAIHPLFLAEEAAAAAAVVVAAAAPSDAAGAAAPDAGPRIPRSWLGQLVSLKDALVRCGSGVCVAARCHAAAVLLGSCGQ